MDDIIAQFEILVKLKEDDYYTDDDEDEYIDPIGDFSKKNLIDMDAIIDWERLESQDRILLEINLKFDFTNEITQIKNNYSKLKYFRNLSMKVDTQFYDRYFMYPFLEFMKRIDEVNKYYLDNIIINSSSNEIVQIIVKNINISLQESNNPLIKLDAIIIAYKNIIILCDGDNTGDILDPTHERSIITKRRKKV